MRLGVLGGAFDPPHIAHMVLAQEAYRQLALERVLFVPTGRPPHKSRQPLWTAEERVAMVEQAIAGNPMFALSRVDVDRPGPHYSVDMLARIHDAWPGYGLFFLMGADELRDLPSWHRPEDVLGLASIAVMRRPDVVVDLPALEDRLPGLTERTVWIDAPLLGISSTGLRQRIEAGFPVRYLVPDAVWQWLEEWRKRRPRQSTTKTL